MTGDSAFTDIVNPNTLHSLKKRSADPVTINDTTPTLYLIRAWQEPGTPSPFLSQPNRHKKKVKDRDECEELHREGFLLILTSASPAGIWLSI